MLTVRDIARQVAARCGSSQATAQAFIAAYWEVVAQEVAAGQEVILHRRIGKIVPVELAARPVVLRGQTRLIPAQRVARLRMYTALQELLNP